MTDTQKKEDVVRVFTGIPGKWRTLVGASNYMGVGHSTIKDMRKFGQVPDEAVLQIGARTYYDADLIIEHLKHLQGVIANG